LVGGKGGVRRDGKGEEREGKEEGKGRKSGK